MNSVIDANCWELYVSEEIRKEPGLGRQLFEKAESQGFILFDAGNLIRQQYIDLKKPLSEELFDAWFTEKVVAGKIQLISLDGRDSLFKWLTELGVPKKEHVYFRVAVFGEGRYIISLDSDFFHPPAKKAGAKAKADLLSLANGSVCKAMRKAHKITICCPEGFVAAA